MLRRLRNGVSVFFATIAIALVILWHYNVRAITKLIVCNPTVFCMVTSSGGTIQVDVHRKHPAAARDYRFKLDSMDVSRHRMMPLIPELPWFRWIPHPWGGIRIVFPHLLLIIATSSIAASPFALRRFSLRSFFIGITFVAVSVGLLISLSAEYRHLWINIPRFLLVMSLVSLVKNGLAVALLWGCIAEPKFGRRVPSTFEVATWYESCAASGRLLLVVALVQLLNLYMWIFGAVDHDYYIFGNFALLFAGPLIIGMEGVYRAHVCAQRTDRSTI